VSESQSAAGPLIHGIPLALWVTIVVAVASPIFTLITVWRSSAISRRNLRDQLVHDAQQRDLERKMSLRRDVFLEAAAALTHTNALVGRAANVDLDQNAIADEFANDLATVSKVHIVANDDTIEAVMTYVNELGPAFMEMTRRRVPLAIRKRMIDTHVALMNKASADRERFIAIMQQYNLQGVRDKEKWDAVNVQAQYASEQFDSQRKNVDQLGIDQTKGQLEISERVMELAVRITRLLPDAVIAVRNEMRMPLDTIRYQRSWALQREKMSEAWAPVRSDIEKLIEKMEADARPQVVPPPLPPP
jgi:hypothetical protein